MFDTLRLLHITDTHLFADPRQRLRGVTTYETLSQVLAAVRRQNEWPPQAVLATGDLSEDHSTQAYQHFDALLRPLDLPVYCTPGNHDDPQEMRAVLTRAPFSMPETVEFPGWTLLLLSSHVPGKVGGALGEAQLQRLDRKLQKHGDRHVLVGLHHAPVNVGSRWMDAYRLADADAFLEILARYGNVRAVLCGHVHQEFHTQHDGIHCFGTPATCGQFLPGSQDFAVDDRPPAWRWLELHADGSIETRVQWLADAPEEAA